MRASLAALTLVVAAACTGNKAVPGLWLSFAAMLGLIAVALLVRRAPAPFRTAVAVASS